MYPSNLVPKKPQAQPGDTASWICSLLLFYHLSFSFYIFILYFYIFLCIVCPSSYLFTWCACIFRCIGKPEVYGQYQFPLLSTSSFETGSLSHVLMTSDAVFQSLFVNFPLDVHHENDCPKSTGLFASHTYLCGCPVGCLSFKTERAWLYSIYLFSCWGLDCLTSHCNQLLQSRKRWSCSLLNPPSWKR